MKPIQLAIDYFDGNQSELARRLNTSQARIWNWLNRDNGIPPEMAVKIEVATAGAVTKEQLCPEVFAPLIELNPNMNRDYSDEAECGLSEVTRA